METNLAGNKKKEDKLEKRIEAMENNLLSYDNDYKLQNQINTNSTAKLNDEYMDLSYKSNTATPLVKNKEQNKRNDPDRKYSMENDFRTKFKTERCKYYQLNKDCKFGESVSKIKKYRSYINIILFSVLSHMEMKI